MSNQSIKPYKLTSIDEEELGSILVFHYTAREAKVDFWKELDFVDYIDIRTRRVDDFMLRYAKRDTPHVVYNPPFCTDCERWGIPLDEEGLCEECGILTAEAEAFHKEFAQMATDWRM